MMESKMKMMKNNLVMMVELEENIFSKISHDLGENPEIRIRGDHILKGSKYHKLQLILEKN